MKLSELSNDELEAYNTFCSKNSIGYQEDGVNMYRSPTYEEYLELTLTR